MERVGSSRRKLSVFTYFFILICVIGITALLFKEVENTEFTDVLYQTNASGSVEEESKYYIKKIKEEYGISINYGEQSKTYLLAVNANPQFDEVIVNNNIKILYDLLKKYPKDVFEIFKEENYSLSITLVSRFNDNNLALASRNNLNQYRIYVSNNENFERSFHHEFFHVLEYYMGSKVKYLYYSWNSYNPYGFDYEPNINKLTDECVYNKYNTEEQNSDTYFVSKYAKTSEKEDRAEIFAELMVLNKKEGYTKNGHNIRNKIDYLLNEIHENVSISDFHFSSYLN